ncbi:MAG TPA: deoxyribonuclease V [Candidatus Limnocylindrales bacterium]|nr:deoxyribonuclease V [Candidatus Limnocylindrales bacterium]
MNYKNLHPWDVDPNQAIQIQKQLRDQLILQKTQEIYRRIAGADVSYDKGSDILYAAVVVLELPNLQIIEEASAVGRSTFPYIPGLLVFREAPILLKAFEKIHQEPDVIMFDGQGIAHPRGIGIASQMGLWLDKPCIGCAKSKLFGDYREADLGPKAGSYTPLTYRGKIIGAVLRTRDNVSPVFVSAGHKIDLATSIELVLKSCQGYRIPEPTRQAHNLVNKIRVEGNRSPKAPGGAQMDLFG